MKPIVILGAGGYAQEILWIIDDLNAQSPTWEFLGFVDPAAPTRRGETLYDRPILGGFEDAKRIVPKDVYFACGIGVPNARATECQAAETLGWQPAALVHPSVIIAKHAEIGAGTVIGAGTIIAPYAKIGYHCAVNLHVTIGHNSQIGAYCSLSPGARISGGVILEERVFIGTNATVYVNRRLGAGSSLGANSFLLTNLEAGQSVIGIPATSFLRAVE